MIENKKIAYFIPNTFTALNMACGFASMILSIHGDFYKASIALILGAIFDSVDGRVARLVGGSSQFGEQFDSLSDVISFGVAPSMLIYNKFFIEYGRIGLIVSFVFMLAGAMRLARFNANINKVSSDYFQGLPIPGGAMAMIGLVLFCGEFTQFMSYKIYFLPFVLFIAFLMISNIPFNSFKNIEWVKNHKRRSLFAVLSLMILTCTYEEVMILAIILIYILSCLIFYFKNRGAMDEIFL